MRPLLLLAGAILAPWAASAPARADDGDKVVFEKKASEWLAILQNDKETNKRRIALFALQTAGPQTRKIFDVVGSALREDKEDLIRKMAAQTLGNLTAKGIEDRIEKLPVKTALDALIFALIKDKSPEVRETAAGALGNIGPQAREAITFLAESLKDASVDVRAAAADSLGRVGESAKDATSALVQALRDNKTKDGLKVRRNIVSAIVRIGKADSTTVAVLAEIGEEAEPADLTMEQRAAHADLRQRSVDALGALGHSSAVQPLSRILANSIQNKDVELSRATIAALNRFGIERKLAIPAFKAALDPSQDQFVRAQAIYAFGRLGKELSADDRKVVVPAIKQALGDKVSDVRLAAIIALGELGPAILGDELKAVKSEIQLATRSGEANIRQAATTALKQLEKTP